MEELLGVAPDVTVLATSRVPLAVAGEQRFEVDGLPRPHPSLMLVEASSQEAVRLFLDRAKRIHIHFALEPRSATWHSPAPGRVAAKPTSTRWSRSSA
ncbi:MAG: hypothetical protein H0U69_16030 [Trueperaceae bacterium]|nr:hypothetical protein [Trueperaceae bacterium]